MELSDFFKLHSRVALAFSGGADSAYLLYAGIRAGADIAPYFVKSQFQPAFEREDARRLAAALGVELRELCVDILACGGIRANPAGRCYLCKGEIMRAVRAAAERDGYATIIDGTNFDDDAADRPGMRALAEEGVLSPLKLCALKKADIRHLSAEAGLFTADKPAYACLATRIPTGEEITAEKLAAVERGEACLMRMGYSDMRVRLRGDGALLQFTAEELPRAAAELALIRGELLKDFTHVTLDMKAREKSR